MATNKKYRIVNDLKNPSRNGQTFEITFPYISAHHVYKYFKPVADWADGAVIEEVEQ